jgi:hypothetical protein
MTTTKNPTIYSRWFCYTLHDNTKIIKRFLLNEIPLNLIDCTTWQRGTGPQIGLAYDNIVNALKARSVGVSKSQHTKQLMSLASKGKPKSLQHRANMSISHKKRVNNGILAK